MSGKLAADFELTASRIVGLAGVGEKQVEVVEGFAARARAGRRQDAKELAEALYFVASSGADTADALDIVNKAARASAAGLGETQVVADATTSAMNAYAQKNLTAAQATDILVATVREGKGEASEIAQVLGNFVPIAAELGVGFDEVGAAVASMTRLGFDAATATTNLSGVFNALLKPAADSKEALAEIGTSAGELRQMLDRRGLLATLEFLEKGFRGNDAALARVFRDVRGFRGVLSLIGKSGEKRPACSSGSSTRPGRWARRSTRPLRPTRSSSSRRWPTCKQPASRSARRSRPSALRSPACCPRASASWASTPRRRR